MKTIHIIASVLAIMLCSPNSDSAQQLPLALEHFLSREYQEINSVGRLPNDIRQALFQRMKHDPRIADPGKRFNKTDVVNSEYPMRRLIVAGAAPGSCFVCYEHGGRGYHRQLVIFRTSDTARPQVEFSGRFFAKVETYTELRSVVNRNLIPDETAAAEIDLYY